MKKVLIVLVLAATASVSFAATAQAGKVLSGNRASALTNLVAERDCDRDPGCERYGVDNCRRQAIRRITCVAITQGTDSFGAAVQCERNVLVRLVTSTGNVKYVTGNRECFFI
ncbi:MAG: hypothetical protein ACR2OC_09660 [Solirubrobacterales bacterium]